MRILPAAFVVALAALPAAGGPVETKDGAFRVETAPPIEATPDGPERLTLRVAGLPAAEGSITRRLLSGDELAVGLDPAALADWALRAHRKDRWQGRARMLARRPRFAGAKGMVWTAFDLVGWRDERGLRGLLAVGGRGARVYAAELAWPVGTAEPAEAVDALLRSLASLTPLPEPPLTEPIAHGPLKGRLVGRWDARRSNADGLQLVSPYGADALLGWRTLPADERDAPGFDEPATWGSIAYILLRRLQGTDALPRVAIEDVVEIGGLPFARVRALTGGERPRAVEVLYRRVGGHAAFLALAGAPLAFAKAYGEMWRIAETLELPGAPASAAAELDTGFSLTAPRLGGKLPSGWDLSTRPWSAASWQLHPRGEAEATLPFHLVYPVSIEVELAPVPFEVPFEELPALLEPVQAKIAERYREVRWSRPKDGVLGGLRGVQSIGRGRLATDDARKQVQLVWLTLNGPNALVISASRPAEGSPELAETTRAVLGSLEVERELRPERTGPKPAPRFHGCQVEVVPIPGATREIPEAPFAVDLPPGWALLRKGTDGALLFGPKGQPAGQEAAGVWYQIAPRGGLGLEGLGEVGPPFLDEVGRLAPALPAAGPPRVIDVNGHQALQQRFEGTVRTPGGGAATAYREATVFLHGGRIHKLMGVSIGEDVETAVRAARATLLRSVRATECVPPATMGVTGAPRIGPKPAAVFFVRARRDGQGGDVYRMRADGRGVERLTDLAGGLARDLTVSLDGRTLAFASDVHGIGSGLGDLEVYAVPAGGGVPRLLSDPTSGPGARAAPGAATDARIVGAVEVKDASGTVRPGVGAMVWATGGVGVALAGADGRFELPAVAGEGWLRVSDALGTTYTAYSVAAGQSTDVGTLRVDEAQGTLRFACKEPAFTADGQGLAFIKSLVIAQTDGRLAGGGSVSWVSLASPGLPEGSQLADAQNLPEQPTLSPTTNLMALVRGEQLSLVPYKGIAPATRRPYEPEPGRPVPLGLVARRPVFSPNGALVAFASFRQPASTAPGDLGEANLFGWAPWMATKRLKLEAGLATAADTGLVQDIFILDLRSGAIWPVTACDDPSEWLVSGLSFSPGGRSIIYGRGGRILKVPVRGGPTEVLLGDYGSSEPVAAPIPR